jgi:aminoglycoside phosphotransferase (APT) family kinase protein
MNRAAPSAIDLNTRVLSFAGNEPTPPARRSGTRDRTDSSLEVIAARVAHAQRTIAKTASGGRYGYAVDPQNAPRERWSEVLQDNLTRSRKRIAAAKLFSHDAVDTVVKLVSAARAQLDSLPPIPFLHDTTTKNVIVTPGGSFSGIVDVDDQCFGDPRYVVALTLAALTVCGGPIHYVDAWMSSANHRDDRIFRLYVVLFIVQVFNGNLLPSSIGDRTRLLGIFAEHLQRLD